MENFQKVEAYFNNELSASEKSKFLSEIDSNAELKSEYNFQKDVINGIKEARKVELKAMLNNVPVASLSTATSALYKILATGAATLLVGTALWYYYSSPLVELKNKNKVVENTELNVQNDVVKNIPIKSNSSNTLEKSKIKEFTEPTAVNKPRTIKNRTKVVTPKMPSAEDGITNQSVSEENLEIPSDISKSPVNISSKVNVEIALRKKYNFHYQYTQGKLKLYGKFEEGLFEVLEVNKEGENDLYLFYKSNFYYLNDDSGNIVPLKAVRDKNLKLKLERLRE